MEKSKFIIISFLILLCSFLLSCIPTSPNNEKNIDKITGTETDKSDSLAIVYRDSLLSQYNSVKSFSYIKKIESGNYSMEIETLCTNDTLACEESEYENGGVFELVSRPNIVKQRLIFKKQGIVQKSFDVPVKHIYRNNYKGEKIKSLEINIWNIFLIHGDKGSIWGVLGTGLCRVGDCPEFTGLYTIDGNIIFQSNTGHACQFNINNFLEKYGITEIMYQNEINNGLRVDIFWNK